MQQRSGNYAKPITAVACAALFIHWFRNKRKKPSMLRPQSRFCKVLTDNSDTPFEHVQPEDGVDDAAVPVHPFQQRIAQLDATPPSMLARDMVKPAAIEAAACHWVASLPDLRSMICSLESVEMLAVDVEHHHLHSYLGFVCLLQLSTGQEDYVVDALALHDHLHLLRPLLADPAVLKVVHGGNNDVLWLQRDFHIYMVNVFDTEKACQVLGRHQRSLAKLLDAYCHVATDKSFQKSDWRVRPLSKAQQAYAQRDAHYLLYLAHVLYLELQAGDAVIPAKKDKSRVMQAWARSQRVSLSLYSKPSSQAAVSAAAAAVMRNHVASPQDLEAAAAAFPDREAQQVVSDCVRALCQWRDDAARNEDEGLQAILPDALLMAVAAARSSSASALVAYAKKALKKLNRETSQRNAYEALPQHVPACFCQQSEEVCHMLDEAARGLGVQQPTQPSKAAAGNANQQRQLQTPEQRQASLRARLVKKFSAKSAVYENCKMYSQEGELLCFCDLRKLTWYESRGLAERVSDDPPAIKLNFMHKTGDQERGVDDYYLHSKENKCVSCGEEGHYLRYKVVPACYRRNFPVQWKSHRSHDIVLLCVDCHHVAHKAAEMVKKQLSSEYGVPLFPPKAQPTGGNVCETHPYNVRRAAVALKVYGKTLPQARRKELQQMVRGFVNPGSGEASSEEWLSQEEMDQGLLAGLAPRQKRRMMRQLAAEKERAPTGANSSLEVTEQAQQESFLGNSSDTDSHNQTASTEQDSLPHVQHDISKQDTEPTSAPHEQPLQQPTVSPEPAEVANRCQQGDQYDQDDSNELIGDGQEAPASRQGVSDEDTNGHAWHGRQVVAAVLEQGGPDALLMLIQRFRQSFTDALHPEHLPAAWHIKHSADRDFGEHSIYATPSTA